MSDVRPLTGDPRLQTLYTRIYEVIEEFGDKCHISLGDTMSVLEDLKLTLWLEARQDDS